AARPHLLFERRVAEERELGVLLAGRAAAGGAEPHHRLAGGECCTIEGDGQRAFELNGLRVPPRPDVSRLGIDEKLLAGRLRLRKSRPAEQQQRDPRQTHRREPHSPTPSRARTIPWPEVAGIIGPEEGRSISAEAG